MARRKKKLLTRFEHPQLMNASKTLLANIRFASVDEEVKTIVVTSSAANEGKTIVATNLAYAIATSGRSVLIVEADMHYRSLNRLLDQHPTHGIYAALSGSAPLDKVIVSTRIVNLYFMDAEPNIPSPSDILSTKRCAALIEKLHEMFDYVIFDTPPVSLFVDAAILSNIADGTLFVTRQNQTKRSLATKCVQQLRVANARILGLVTTFCEGDDSLYYYAYYTQDGKRANKDAPKHSNGSGGSSSSGGSGSSGGKSADSASTTASSVPRKPVMINPGEATKTAPDKSDASAKATSFGFEPTASTESDTTSTADTGEKIYAPNAYRALSTKSQRPSRQKR
jgi:capsular exopolysaccharide synthesis family protein